MFQTLLKQRRKKIVWGFREKEKQNDGKKKMDSGTKERMAERHVRKKEQKNRRTENDRVTA